MIYSIITIITKIIPFCCWCNETEDVEHYLFHCNTYRNERHQFFATARDFQSLTISILLYANETLDFQLNIELFSAVHGYIKNTKRFDNTEAHFPLIRTFKCYHITVVFSTIPLYSIVCRASPLLGTGGSILTNR